RLKIILGELQCSASLEAEEYLQPVHGIDQGADTDKSPDKQPDDDLAVRKPSDEFTPSLLGRDYGVWGGGSRRVPRGLDHWDLPGNRRRSDRIIAYASVP